MTLARLRWPAVAVWLAAFAIQIALDGFPLDREGLILWLAAGLVAVSLGRRAPWTVIVDWLPFALVLLGYDFARGASDTLGMPTWWTPQLDVDKALFGGTVPTLWLQEHLKQASVRWWDVLVSITYYTFFLLPYITAGVFWLRSRTEFHRWAVRFVALSFVGFATFALAPTAPPWAAARCTGAQVSSHPNNPPCLYHISVPNSGGLLGRDHPQPGAFPIIDRISDRGWPSVHLTVAKSLLDKGDATSNLVAAVPSLHAGTTMLLTLFLWRRVRWRWRAVLIGYDLVMAFALVYAAEHYVSDILAGWLVAAGVTVVADAAARRRLGRRFGRHGGRAGTADTLDAVGNQDAGTHTARSAQCPPTATTPWSTLPSGGASSSRPARSTGAPAPPGTTARWALS